MSDEQAMNEVKRGNLDRSALLFERYQVRLYNFFLRLTYDRDLSNDLVQTVFLRLIRYRESYRENGAFKSWIYQLARNVFHDQLAQQKLKRGSSLDLEQIAHEAAALSTEQEQADRELALHKALSLLDQEQREVLILSKFQQMKYQEIAEVMGTTESNIKVKVHRAIQKLRGLYFMVET